MRGRTAIADVTASGSASAVPWNRSSVVAGAGLSEVRDVFIDDAVAIVIECVAGFVVGRTSARANACGEGAGPASCIAGDHDAGRAFRSRGAGADAANLDGGRSRCVFIDGTIAVVVDAITRFRCGNVRTRVFALLVVVEVVVARLATLECAHSIGARPVGMDGAVITIVAAGSAIGHVRLQVGLVCQLTIAIGVDPARIRGAGWSNRTIALDHAACAALRAGFTGAGCTHRWRCRHIARPCCVGGGRACGRIDLAVAVVIDAIARFRAGIDRSDAHDASALALLGSERTRENVRRSARSARIGRIVVDDAVAVVIHAVTRFRDWIDRAHANEHSVLALLRAVFTRSHVGLSALRANPNGRIVDHAIAIIVDPVACFRLCIDGPDANQAASLTLVGTEFASTRIGCSALRAHARGHVVDNAVAIVVLSVACFCLRIDGARADQRAALAQHRPEFTRERVVLTA